MSFRGFLIRLGFVAVVTWILGAISGSFGWALYLALTPIAYYEILRPR
jgi:hypothetical protein